jgi:hypothetical protein
MKKKPARKFVATQATPEMLRDIFVGLQERKEAGEDRKAEVEGRKASSQDKIKNI